MISVFILMDQGIVGGGGIGAFTTLAKAREYALGFESICGLFIEEHKLNPTADEQWEPKRFEVKL